MPPYDELITPALQKVYPSANTEVEAWPLANKSIADIEKDAEKVREMKVDLVIIAVPASAGAGTVEEYIRSYFWVMNWSLSYSYQQWDCIAIPPSVAEPDLDTAGKERDRQAQQLIKAQGMGIILREDGKRQGVDDLLENWLQRQITDK